MRTLCQPVPIRLSGPAVAGGRTQSAQQRLAIDVGQAERPGQRPPLQGLFPTLRAPVQVTAAARCGLPYVDNDRRVTADESNQVGFVLPATAPQTGTDRFHNCQITQPFQPVCAARTPDNTTCGRSADRTPNNSTCEPLGGPNP